MRRNQVDAKRSRLWVARLKNSLSVEHPIAGDQLGTVIPSIPLNTRVWRGTGSKDCGDSRLTEVRRLSQWRPY